MERGTFWTGGKITNQIGVDSSRRSDRPSARAAPRAPAVKVMKPLRKPERWLDIGRIMTETPDGIEVIEEPQVARDDRFTAEERCCPLTEALASDTSVVF